MKSEEQKQKYSYQFSVKATRLGDLEVEPDRSDLQAYINEVLGLPKAKKPEPELAQV